LAFFVFHSFSMSIPSYSQETLYILQYLPLVLYPESPYLFLLSSFLLLLWDHKCFLQCLFEYSKSINFFWGHCPGFRPRALRWVVLKFYHVFNLVFRGRSLYLESYYLLSVPGLLS
jgi:hypothetical protein